MSDRTVTILVLVAMAVFYLVVPIAVSMGDQATDLTASLLLALALSFYAYRDHKDEKPRDGLLKVIGAFMVPAAIVMAGLLVMIPGFPFILFIPLNAALGGVMYWYIEKHLPPEI